MNFCCNAYRSSLNKDENGKKIIMCNKTKMHCTVQRYCNERQDYIVSENAEKYCKNYNKQ